MAVAPLNLTPELQSWHLAGLVCLLLDEDAASQVREAGSTAASRASAQPGHAPRPADAPGPQQPVSSFAATPSPDNASPLVSRSASPAREAPQTATVSNPVVPELAPAAWPGPWRELLDRMQPAPLAWTYPELGEDLLQAGNKERSAALREIISRLRLPRGSSTFWPARLPAQASSSTAGSPEADYFRAGLQQLDVRFLIVFGPGSLAGTTYEALQLKPFSEQLADGRLFLALPDFSSLLSVPGRLDKVVMFLDSVLSRFLRA